MLSNFKMYGSLILLLLLCGSNTPLLAAEEETSKIPTAKELIEHKYHLIFNQGRDMSAHIHMVTTESNGEKREIEQSYIRWDKATSDDPSVDVYCDQKYYSYIYSPADFNKTVFVTWKYIGKDDDRWLYIPYLDFVKRIPPIDERAPYMGTTFCTEDSTGRDFEKDIHELVEVTDNYYVVKSTPKEPDTVEFSYNKTWMHRETLVPTCVKWYDKNGELQRQYDVLMLEIKDGFVYPYKLRMKDLKTKRETVLSFSKMQFNTGITEDIFLERFMRNPPEEVFR
ncbi:MAG: outer membrane lipoprotein-sorting protein [Candidatus Brocadiales bacterium]